MRGDPAQVTAAIKPKKINKRDKQGNAPLHYAASQANQEISAILINAGADVNVQNKKYQTTPLHDLARTVETNRKRIRETAQLLLTQGADPWLVDNHGESVLIAGARSGNAVLVRAILNYDPSNTEETALALSVAREHGRYSVIRVLESLGVESESGKEKGILNAAALGQYSMLENLIRPGVDVDLKSESGETPLILATRNGHTEVVRLLLTHSAEINIQSQQGNFPLYLAAEAGDLNLIQLLLEHGAEINFTSETKGRSINGAANKEQLPIVNFLIEHGAEPVTVSTDGETAFGSGLSWLLFAEFHEKDRSPSATTTDKERAKTMLTLAEEKFSEQKEHHEKLRRKKKRGETITNIIAASVATTAMIGLERMQREAAAANRRQITQIRALSDASSHQDYFRRVRIYESAMINTELSQPYQIDFTDTTLMNANSISGLDVMISEYERRIALTQKLLESVSTTTAQ